MRFNAIIFDMDGTIIDTEHIWHQATQELIQSRGVTLSVDEKKTLSNKLCGCCMATSCSIIKETLKLSEPLETLMREKSSHAYQLYKTDVIFIDGFLKFHQDVQHLNLKTGVATNADATTVQITDSRLNLSKLFGEHIYNLSHVNNVAKPDPALYLLAAQKLAEEPEKCLAIEDSASGIQAAKSAGMFCIGINSGKNPDQLQQADMIIDSYKEIDLKKLLAIP